MAKAKKTKTTSSARKISITPVLVTLLIIAAFAMGYLFNRMQYYQDKAKQALTVQPSPAPSAHPLAKNSLLTYAKTLSLDEKKFQSCLNDGKYKKQVQEDMNQGIQLGVNGTPAFFLNGHLIVGAQPTQVFTDAIDFALTGGNLSNPTGAAKYLADSDNTNGEIGTEKIDVDLGNAQAKGNKNASVTLLEFSDFECPYCARFFTQTLPTLMKKYVESGKVYLVYKQFPLSTIHSHAQEAAEAALCAAEQGKFWQYHDKLFSSMQNSAR